jgi:hypothetical protein
MATNTTIQQGVVTATGNNLWIPSINGADWVEVVNYTQTIASTQWAATKFYWQYGMAQDDALQEFHSTASQIVSTSFCSTGYNGATYHGISVVDSTATPNYGASIAVAAVTNAAPPVVTTGTTTGLIANNSIVRLSGLTTGTQMCGIDFSIGVVVTATSFTLAHMPIPAAGGTGFYRQIPFPSLYYPRRRYITQVTRGTSTVLVTSVTNSFNVGESVRFVVPAAFGMTQLNGLLGTVTAVNQIGTTGNNTVTVDIDSSSFTAFTFPLVAAVPFSYAEIIPVGEDTASALANNTNILADSTYNTGWTGIILGTDATVAAVALGSAGGTAGDVIYWRAGSSFNNNVQNIPAVY